MPQIILGFNDDWITIVKQIRMNHWLFLLSYLLPLPEDIITYLFVDKNICSLEVEIIIVYKSKCHTFAMAS